MFYHIDTTLTLFRFLFWDRLSLTCPSRTWSHNPPLSASWVAGIVYPCHQTWLSIANPKSIYRWELQVKASRFKISLKTSGISMYHQQKLGRSFKMEKKAMSSQTAPNIKYKETQQKKARLRESYMKHGWEKSKKSCRTADCTSS